MSRENIFTGTTANDGTGDTLRQAFTKTNNNFIELYSLAIPGGNDTQLQYNNAGAFAGASGLTTNGTELTIASGTKTADAPVLNMSQTWNNGAVTFTGLKFNVTDTASNASSLLMDLGTGGGSFVSRFNVTKGGALAAPITGVTHRFGSSTSNVELRVGDFEFTATAFGTTGFHAGLYGVYLKSDLAISWSSSSGSAKTGVDLYLTRRAAANLRLGAADAAAPVAQTLSVQSVVAGTTNTAGANLTITGSQGTGTGAGGSIIFQVAPAGGSGSAQNALSTALTIMPSAGNSTYNGLMLSAPNSGIPRLNNVVHGLIDGGFVEFDNALRLGRGSTIALLISSSSVQITNNLPLAFNSGTSGDGDTVLRRDAANTLALRNGTNAQENRIYGTFTDASNYRRVASGMSTAGVGFIRPEGAGTGASGNVIHISGLPTSNPGPGILWNNAGTPAIGT